jgi:hypothetical protein
MLRLDFYSNICIVFEMACKQIAMILHLTFSKSTTKTYSFIEMLTEIKMFEIGNFLADLRLKFQPCYFI